MIVILTIDSSQVCFDGVPRTRRNKYSIKMNNAEIIFGNKFRHNYFIDLFTLYPYRATNREPSKQIYIQITVNLITCQQFMQKQKALDIILLTVIPF